jgi:hypothetical protein
MASAEEIMLAPQFDGLAAVVRALISELAANNAELRQRLAREAGSDIREKTKSFENEAARNVMLLTAARICGLPAGFLVGQ